MFTDAEKADEAKRESGYRRRVYARLVQHGNMKQADADRKLAIMDEIERDYRAKVEAGEPKLL